MSKKALNIPGNRPVHPVREVLDGLLGTHTITAVFEEDTQTLTALKNVDGLIAIICKLSKNGRVLAEGRGSSVLNQTNKYVNRQVFSAFDSSLVDAVIRSTKILGTFRGPSDAEVDEAYKARDMAEAEAPTEKQLAYLRQLIQTNVEDDHDRDRWESQLGEMTKREAGSAIESFLR